MCGIFGSKDYKTYIELYAKNKDRGAFAYGSIMIDNDLHACIKAPGVFKLTEKLYLNLKNNKKKDFKSFKNYLGHSQAPTSSVRKYTHDTSHPFNTGSWYVAHNGVLSNEKDLRPMLKKYKTVNSVDTSLIPALIEHYCKIEKNEHQAVCAALSQLKGNYGLWILNSKNNHVYLARSGSTLYADFITNDFSSVKYRDFKALEEGVLYLQTVEGLTSVCTFKTQSPFFTP
jgi:glucosamine 6-phosphate synthetase-like amidotransferase/phosphosugar isomerase protein